MKNVFGRPYSDNGQAPFDGERFVTERVDPAFKNEIDSSKQRVEDVKKSLRMSMKTIVIMGLLSLAFPFGFLRITTLCNTMTLSEAFAKEPLVFVACLFGFVIDIAFMLMLVRSSRKQKNSPELAEANARLASLDKNSEIMLGLPQEYEKVDVLSFEYVEKDGKVKMKNGTNYFANGAMKLFRKDDMLCLADAEKVCSFPINDVKRYVLKKKKAIMDRWNKETPHNEGRYTKYRISTNDSGSLNCKFCAMRCADSFGEYEVFFPVYELEAFKAIADAPTEKE